MDRSRDQVESLLLTHRARIRAYLLAAARDAAEAEDLTQETMLRAWRAYPSLRDEAAATAWLYRIATNLLVERARSNARRPIVSADLRAVEHRPDSVDSIAGDPSQSIGSREMSACIRALAADITEAQRATLLLHDGFGLTNPEIAAILGCSIAAVKIRLHRARAHMARLVESHCSLSQDERGVLVCESRPAR